MNASTNQFQESGARHSATDTAAAPSSVPTDGRGGQAPFHVPDEVVINLPMPPTSNNLFVNSARAGRCKSPAYRAWIKDAGYRLNAQHPPLTDGKVAILIEIEEPKTARLQDCANREKAPVDLLVSHGLIRGDDQRYVREVTTRWVSSIEGVRVTIRPLTSVAGGGG